MQFSAEYLVRVTYFSVRVQTDLMTLVRSVVFLCPRNRINKRLYRGVTDAGARIEIHLSACAPGYS